MSQAILKALECVASLYLIGMVGYCLSKRGWFSQETKLLFPRLVTVVTIPPYLFVSLLRTFSREEFTEIIYGVILPSLSILICYGLSLAANVIFKVRKEHRGLLSTGVTASNTIFIGLPVNLALFGEEALPYVLLYFFPNTTFFWTLGNWSMSRGGDRPQERIWEAGNIKRLFSPPLVGFMLAIAFIMAKISPPRFIMDAAYMLGSLTTPMAILFIGIAMADCSFRTLKPDREIWLVLVGRFLVSPLSIILLSRFFTLNPLMAKVFIIQSSLPCAANLAIMAAYHGTDPVFGARCVAVTTLLSVAMIPLTMALITYLYG
jgi:predicted permease